jgi:GH25 family lysozyme M1 (1,4-beta-N-acetylmuramidase)
VEEYGRLCAFFIRVRRHRDHHRSTDAWSVPRRRRMTDKLIVDVSAANALGRAPGRVTAQDDLDWKWLASTGAVGAYVEGFVGNDGANPDYEAQMQDAIGAGLVVGTYNFVYPLPNAIGHPARDPVSQAKLHAERCGPWKPGMLPTMCDFEWPAPEQAARWGVDGASKLAWLMQYLPAMDDLVGCSVGLYSYLDFWQEILSCGAPVPPELASRPLWVAGPDWVRPPWTTATLWQMTGRELHVPTTTGRPPVLTDCSKFLGDDDAWQKFLGLVPSELPTKPELDS